MAGDFDVLASRQVAQHGRHVCLSCAVGLYSSTLNGSHVPGIVVEPRCHEHTGNTGSEDTFYMVV